MLIIFLHPYVQSQYLFYLAEQYSAQFSIKTAAVNKMELIFFNIWDLYISYRKKPSQNESQMFKVKLGTVFLLFIYLFIFSGTKTQTRSNITFIWNYFQPRSDIHLLRQ